MIVWLKFISKLDHFIYKKIIYDKMIQPNMSDFQMIRYCKDVRLGSGLLLLNSNLSLNRAFYNRTCPDIGCSMYDILVNKIKWTSENHFSLGNFV
jgi:hypothetical protein